MAKRTNTPTNVVPTPSPAVRTDTAVLGVDSPEFPKALLLEGVRLKAILNERVKDDEYDPEFHLARRCKEVMEELALVQAEAGVDRIEGCGVRFRARLQDGRRVLKQDLMVQALVARGVEAGVVAEAVAEATVRGEGYWVREIEKVSG